MRFCNKPHCFGAGHGGCERQRFLIRPGPFLRGATRHVANICLRLQRQRTLSGKPVANALGASVVGGGRQAEIAELGTQLTQELGRFRQRLDRIKGVVQKALCSRRRHELGDTLSPMAGACYGPHDVGPKTAFPPNDLSKELERQPVCGRRGFEQLANGWWVGCWNGAGIRRRRFLAGEPWRRWVFCPTFRFAWTV